MLSLALLLLPLFALAAPSSEGQLATRSTPIKPNKAYTWIPTETETYEYIFDDGLRCNFLAADNQTTANSDDCVNLQTDIFHNNGVWQMDGITKPDDPNDWNLLGINGTCTILVQNSSPTKIANGDASFCMSMGTWQQTRDRDWIEYKFYLVNDEGTMIDFWVRNTAGLDLSNIVGQ
ncbi:uncharacterized protein GGS22DRAFT_195436 [Annulohypoxylon maeteangense]|uniref:uncharacterized protein n=1 Tax=Annulohypoxylon maeteangense TaxID=1927788 RepID=UPI002007D6DF|nr:uncharacterized protein GGS22DRAFT_195436 [Annulohypoxylon maeteangense]KAI0883237.1 hypothetical protein GGS22DRAFT_195436 [Annulohypoxylon maeteangense]